MKSIKQSHIIERQHLYNLHTTIYKNNINPKINITFTYNNRIVNENKLDNVNKKKSNLMYQSIFPQHDPNIMITDRMATVNKLS